MAAGWVDHVAILLPAYHVQIQANHASIGYAPQQLLGQRIGMVSGTNGTAGK
jgi:hypothetical protein